MKKIAALCALLTLVVSPVIADETEYRVKHASDLILKLCIASGVQSVEINKKVNSIEVAGDGSSLEIDRRVYSGLIGGLSKEITALSAQQASEARSCTQRYLKDLVNMILNDEPGNQVRSSGQATVSSENLVKNDPETFWGGRGIWENNQNYCEGLLKFLSASSGPGNFRYLDGEKVSPETVSTKFQKIEGNYIIRTGLGSGARFCGVYDNDSYNALSCSRVVSFGRRDIFASVYNQTLKDMRDCLLPAGWKQSSLDQVACIPTGRRSGECVRRFSKGYKDVWLFSNVEEGSRYLIGIQTNLGG